jgi:hypothetical protein
MVKTVQVDGTTFIIVPIVTDYYDTCVECASRGVTMRATSLVGPADGPFDSLLGVCVAHKNSVIEFVAFHAAS